MRRETKQIRGRWGVGGAVCGGGGGFGWGWGAVGEPSGFHLEWTKRRSVKAIIDRNGTEETVE